MQREGYRFKNGGISRRRRHSTQAVKIRHERQSIIEVGAVSSPSESTLDNRASEYMTPTSHILFIPEKVGKKRKFDPGDAVTDFKNKLDLSKSRESTTRTNHNN